MVGNFVPIYIRYTNLRFMAGEDYFFTTPYEKELKFDRHDCVTVPTAIVVELDGYVTTAIRKRWYDMIFYKLKSLMGYWEN
jgi:hypothetical protein